MYKKIKRIVDFISAIILLIVLSPFMLIIATIVKINDGGPALFIQDRSGKDGKIFKLYKFRSMVICNDVTDFKCEDSVTKIGKFIRKTSLDELPQLFNIIKGEMSFIGPRPWILEYSKYFTKKQKRRLEVLPGITGLAQCNGRNDLTIQEKINLDIKYVDNFSLRMDLIVLGKTLLSVLKGQGVHSSKYAIKAEIEELKKQVI